MLRLLRPEIGQNRGRRGKGRADYRSQKEGRFHSGVPTVFMARLDLRLCNFAKFRPDKLQAGNVEHNLKGRENLVQYQADLSHSESYYTYRPTRKGHHEHPFWLQVEMQKCSGRNANKERNNRRGHEKGIREHASIVRRGICSLESIERYPNGIHRGILS